jgi:hypothetical protein
MIRSGKDYCPMVNLNEFILAELEKAETKALADNDYALPYSQIYLLANYAAKSKQLDILPQTTIDKMLALCHTFHDKYRVDAVKDKAFALYRAENGKEPVINIKGSFTKKGIDYYRTRGDEIMALHFSYYYKQKNGKYIFNEAKETIPDFLSDTFYTLSDKLSYSENFTNKIIHDVYQWNQGLPPEPDDWKEMKPEEKALYLSKLQIDLQKKFDPSGFLKDTNTPYFVEPIENSVVVKNQGQIKRNKDSFDETTLIGVASSYLQMFGIISFPQNILEEDIIEENFIENLNHIIETTTSNKRKSIFLMLDLENKKSKVHSSSINNYYKALEIIAHETTHQFQHECYFGYLNDPERTKDISLMTDRDFFLLKLSDIVKVRGHGASSDQFKKYENNPNEKQAYLVSNKFKEFLTENGKLKHRKKLSL